MFPKALFRNRACFLKFPIIASLTSLGIAGICLHREQGQPAFSFPGRLLLDNTAHKSPKFTPSQVAEHRTKESRIWVTYKSGVYDITDFVESHPGGEKILMAAGSNIEPFWRVYTIHNSVEVRKILESLRIGDLDDSQEHVSDSAPDMDDPFSGDPVRSPILQVRSNRPFNAETPSEILADIFFTPNEVFYKRSHGPIPNIAKDEFVLEIEGIGLDGKSVSVSLADLEKLPQTSITAALQCCGNRRGEFAEFAPVQGLLWGSGAIGNAAWTGVKLIDLIRSLPDIVKQEELTSQTRHVHFEGYDGYAASVPASKAFSKTGDVLLALKMNNEDLPREHGSPVRVIIPGHTAARSVKWLKKIVFSKNESSHHFMKNDYKGFSPSSDWNNLDWKKAVAVQELPVQSAILEPNPTQIIKPDDKYIHVKGYAWSGGGRAIVRVDVSANGGKTWQDADLEQEEQPDGQAWSWTKWETYVPIPTTPENGYVTIVCKAVDSSYNVQPNDVDGIYNKRGLLNNAWHRVRLKISDDKI